MTIDNNIIYVQAIMLVTIITLAMSLEVTFDCMALNFLLKELFVF